VLIRNCFYARQVNSRKITIFKKITFLTFLFKKIPSTQGTKFCHRKLESMRQLTVNILWF